MPSLSRKCQEMLRCCIRTTVTLCVISTKNILGCVTNAHVGESHARCPNHRLLTGFTSDHKAFTKPELTKHVKNAHGVISDE